MKLHQLATACLFAVTCALTYPQTAFCDNFEPLRITPQVKIEFDTTTIDLSVTKYGSGATAKNQNLVVIIQSLGKLPETREHIAGIQVVADYGENEAPVLLRSWVQTNEYGNAHIRANLPNGRYLFKITYDGQENSNWRPMLIPLTTAGIGTECSISFKLNTKEHRALYKNNETVRLRPSVDFSECSLRSLGDFKLIFNDGVKQTSYDVSPSNPEIEYKSERTGTFKVDVDLSLVLPTAEKNKGNLMVSRPSQDTLEISGFSMRSSDLRRNLYFYDGALVKPEPLVEKKLFSVQIDYPISYNAEANGIDLSALNLGYCDESGDNCEMTSRQYQWGGYIRFKTPDRVTGTIYPKLYIGDTPCDEQLPPITIESDAPLYYGGAAALVLLIAGIIIIRKQMRRSAIPKLPPDDRLDDQMICRSYIKTCYDIIAKKRVNATVDWEYETIESFYKKISSGANTSDAAFEKYSFDMNIMLKNDSLTKEDLTLARKQSLDMLK